jgi:hypothetical protein
MSATKGIKEKLAAAKLPEKTVPICLRGDLQAEFEELERQLAEAEKRHTDSLAGNGSRAIAEQIEALREQMIEHTVEFRLRARPRREFKAIVDAHPPRRAEDGGVDDRDKWMGVNADTFLDALVRVSVVEPELDEDDWATLDAALTDRQFDQLYDAAWGLNRREVDVPFSRAASKILGSGSE